VSFRGALLGADPESISAYLLPNGFSDAQLRIIVRDFVAPGNDSGAATYAVANPSFA